MLLYYIITNPLCNDFISGWYWIDIGSPAFRFVIYFYQYVALLLVFELPYIMEIGRVFRKDAKPGN